MLDLYIKTSWFPMTPVKNWKIIRADEGDFIKIDNCDVLLPLNPHTLLFQDDICDFTLDDRIPFVIYDKGDLQYIYSLRKEDNIMKDFEHYSRYESDDLISPIDFLKSLQLPVPKK